MEVRKKAEELTEKIFGARFTSLNLRAKRQILIFLILLSSVFLFSVFIFVFLPKPTLYDDSEGFGFSRVVYSRDGELLRLTLSPDEKYRLRTSLPRISPLLKEATLLHEDKYFRYHLGVNPLSLVRAAFKTYIGGSRRLGASTITMQLARMRFDIDSRSIGGKLIQIFRAVQLERHYSKNEIFEAYLNIAPYGRNIEGVGAATLIYFGKASEELTLHEALTLAIIPQSPSRRTPLTEKDLGNSELINARAGLSERWVRANPSDAEKLESLKLPMLMSDPSELPFLAPHLTDLLLVEEKNRAQIISTLDLSLQRLIERKAKSYVERKTKFGITNTTVMLLNFETMELSALLGSVDFFNSNILGQVNGARGKRSPGSTLKPFIYALGMEQGIIHPYTILKDAPASYAAFNPENFDAEFMGPIRAKDALIKSRNLPAVQVANKLNDPDLYDFLKKAGITKLRERDFYGLALVLGGAETTMEELISLYAMLANKGIHRPIRMTMDAPSIVGEQILSTESSYLVMDMLGDNPRPDRGIVKIFNEDDTPVFWKTGTSYGFRDAWSFAIAGPYVLGVWVGNFNGEGNPAFVGRTAAAPLLFEIIDGLKAEEKNKWRFYDRANSEDVPGVKEVHVCSVSGGLPSKFCEKITKTWFIPGRSPIKKCDIHREVILDRATGLRTCGKTTKKVRREVYEFWPSDLTAIFKKAGLGRRLPPGYNKDCDLSEKSGFGLPPEITSPQKGLTYNLRASAKKGEEQIALSAVTDADTKELYWFVDENYLGKGGKDKPFFWRPTPGNFVVRAVDDHGRSDSRKVKVVMVE